MGSLTISQAREQLSSRIPLFATRGDILWNCPCVRSHRFTVPGSGAASHPSRWGVHPPSALVPFPVGVSLEQPHFQPALCLYLGQAYFNSAGTGAGL